MLRSLASHTRTAKCGFSAKSLPFAFRNALANLTPLSAAENSLKTALPFSKIVATVGPSSEQWPKLGELGAAGLGIMRINFSHATYDEALLRVTNLNRCREGAGSFGPDSTGADMNMLAILLDTQGPEIRTGNFANGAKNCDFAIGDVIRMTPDPSFRTAQTKEVLWTSYSALASTVSVGTLFLIDDGAMQIEVLSIDGNDITARVLNAATLGNKKGCNIPGVSIALPAMSDKDRADIAWGLDNGIDYIAASFVRRAADVIEIRNFCKEHFAKKGDKSTPLPLIISKIESTEGLENYEEILEVSDAIMVARGDLAVEIPCETLAMASKHMIRRCNEVGKPVIVATQMLESMQKSPRPTRAELTDVANAILDGADCVMLSGESAQGKYPTESVATMHRIMHETEAVAIIDGHSVKPLPVESSAVADLANEAVSFTKYRENGRTFDSIVVNLPSAFSADGLKLNSDIPRLIAKSKPDAPIFVAVPTYKAGRQLALHRAIKPVLLPMATMQKDNAAFLTEFAKTQSLNGNGVVLVGDKGLSTHVF